MRGNTIAENIIIMFMCIAIVFPVILAVAEPAADDSSANYIGVYGRAARVFNLRQALWNMAYGGCKLNTEENVMAVVNEAYKRWNFVMESQKETVLTRFVVPPMIIFKEINGGHIVMSKPRAMLFIADKQAWETVLNDLLDVYFEVMREAQNAYIKQWQTDNQGKSYYDMVDTEIESRRQKYLDNLEKN